MNGISGVGMRVYYRSGEMVVTGRAGTVEQAEQTRRGFRYFVRWDNGESGWYLAQNLSF